MKKDVKLYNVLFPVWMLMTIPQTWVVVIPGNFLMDSLVLIFAMMMLKMENRKEFYKKHILKVFALGFLADILAAIPMGIGAWGFEFGGPYGDSLLLTLPGVLLAAVLIFVFDYFVSFRECEKGLRLRLALTFAIVTAPYTYMIPSGWIYGF